jgi:hypothetical protein
LKRVAVTTGDQHSSAAPFFFMRGRGEKIISLESRRLCILKAAGNFSCL